MEDFYIETKLKKEAPDLHRRMTDSVLVLQKMLESFFNWFANYTDHSSLHSMDVLYFCNQMIRERAELLSAAECYVLIMSCYLHDVGMGIDKNDYESFTRQLNLREYFKLNPDASEAKVIRDFHNELSGLFINKYAELFDIPSEEMKFAIMQVSRGHRKTDLYNEEEYPDINTPYGIIRTSYLAAILRLADEIDVGKDRNPGLLFDTSSLTEMVDINAFGTHDSIRTVEVERERIVLRSQPIEPRFEALIEELAGKIQNTLDYCRNVTEKYDKLGLTQKTVEIENV